MGWFCSPERLFKPSRSRFVFLLLGAVAFAITEFGRFVARPYVRRHGINDVGLTDCIGNLGGILVIIFLGCAAYNADIKQSYDHRTRLDRPEGGSNSGAQRSVTPELRLGRSRHGRVARPERPRYSRIQPDSVVIEAELQARSLLLSRFRGLRVPSTHPPKGDLRLAGCLWNGHRLFPVTTGNRGAVAGCSRS